MQSPSCSSFLTDFLCIRASLVAGRFMRAFLFLLTGTCLYTSCRAFIAPFRRPWTRLLQVGRSRPASHLQEPMSLTRVMT